MKVRKFLLKDLDFGTEVVMTIPEILEEINRDRSENWTDYDESDWPEGLDQFTQYELVKDVTE